MPVGGTQNTKNLSNLWSKDFDQIFDESMMKWEPEYTFYTRAGTMDAYLKKGEVSKLGLLQQKEEGAPRAYESMKQGNTKTVYPTAYSLATVVTEEMRDRDKTGYMAQLPSMLSESFQHTMEYKAIDLLEGAFVTTYRTALDGYALCADAHTILDPFTGAPATTFDNLGTASVINATSLAAARLYFQKLRNSKGFPVQGGRRLCVLAGPDNEDLLKLHLGNEYEVNSMDRNMNLNQGTMTYKILHYLDSTSAGYWWVIDLEAHDLWTLTEKAVYTGSFDDQMTGNTVYYVAARWANDFFSAYPVWGNTAA